MELGAAVLAGAVVADEADESTEERNEAEADVDEPPAAELVAEEEEHEPELERRTRKRR